MKRLKYLFVPIIADIYWHSVWDWKIINFNKHHEKATKMWSRATWWKEGKEPPNEEYKVFE